MRRAASIRRTRVLTGFAAVALLLAAMGYASVAGIGPFAALGCPPTYQLGLTELSGDPPDSAVPFDALSSQERSLVRRLLRDDYPAELNGTEIDAYHELTQRSVIVYRGTPYRVEGVIAECSMPPAVLLAVASFAGAAVAALAGLAVATRASARS